MFCVVCGCSDPVVAWLPVVCVVGLFVVVVCLFYDLFVFGVCFVFLMCLRDVFVYC